MFSGDTETVWSCECGNDLFTVQLIDDLPWLFCVCCGGVRAITIPDE